MSCVYTTYRKYSPKIELEYNLDICFVCFCSVYSTILLVQRLAGYGSTNFLGSVELLISWKDTAFYFPLSDTQTHTLFMCRRDWEFVYFMKGYKVTTRTKYHQFSILCSCALDSVSQATQLWFTLTSARGTYYVLRIKWMADPTLFGPINNYTGQISYGSHT